MDAEEGLSNLQAGETEINVIQTPTSQAVREAQGDTDLLDRRRTVSFLSSFTSRISRAKSFHASASDLQKLDGAAPPRARLLTFSKSQPDLKAAESVDPPPKGLVVLGKEARRRSRRYILSEDGTLNSNLIAGRFPTPLIGRIVCCTARHCRTAELNAADT